MTTRHPFTAKLPAFSLRVACARGVAGTGAVPRIRSRRSGP